MLDRQSLSMGKGKMNKVLFPHWFHRIRYKCKVCHETIFRMKKGSNNINMYGIIKEEWCGTCHNGVIAFDPLECDKCHSYNEEEEARKILAASKVKNPCSGNSVDEKAGLPFTAIGEQDSIGDHSFSPGEAARIGAGPHPPALELEGLPKDKWGLIDWPQLVKEGIITPKASLDPEGAEERLEDIVILFETKSQFVDDVLFPHDVHTYWLDCKSCHNSIFKDKVGANKVFMNEISEGKWCGECHGKVSFPLDGCDRCHTESKE